MSSFIFVTILFVLPYWGVTQELKVINLKAINTSQNELSPVLFEEDKSTYLVFSSTSKNKKSILYKSLIEEKEVALEFTLGEVERFEEKGMPKRGQSYSAFSTKGEQIFLTRSPDRWTKRIVYKNKEGNKWGDFRCLPFSCTNEWNTAYPYLIEDELYFASDMPGGFGGWDLYVSYYENGRWGSPINLGPSVNSEQHEITPFVNEKHQLFFSSDRVGGKGGYDIYYWKL